MNNSMGFERPHLALRVLLYLRERTEVRGLKRESSGFSAFPREGRLGSAPAV
jgi:hypothetical protein